MSQNERDHLADSLDKYGEWCHEQANGIARLIEVGAMPTEDGQQMISNLRQEAAHAQDFAALLRSRR